MVEPVGEELEKSIQVGPRSMEERSGFEGGGGRVHVHSDPEVMKEGGLCERLEPIGQELEEVGLRISTRRMSRSGTGVGDLIEMFDKLNKQLVKLSTYCALTSSGLI